MRRHQRWSAVAAGVVLFLVGGAWFAFSETEGGGPAKPLAAAAAESPLPIRQVVLFNSGVAYLQREGQVQDDASVNLSFSTDDMNDLLKSLVLQDLSGGRVSTVSYDSHDPLDKTLRSFAIDLSGNPTFAQILHQTRGESVEIQLRDKKDAPLQKLTGVIVGMEAKTNVSELGALNTAGPEMLNLSTKDGMRSVPLDQVTAVKFINPSIDRELNQALRVLARGTLQQKKSVALNFQGKGKRNVRVGYVVERPIWRTTYRLRLEPNGKVYLQGWAMVENPSDDDWKDVQMTLVSGRPISFKMNLYEPLYQPRPTVEPEHYALLRPPVHSEGMMGAPPAPIAEGGPPQRGFGQFGGAFGGQFGGGQFGGGFGGQFGGGQFGGGFNGGPMQGGMQGGFNGGAINRLTFEELQQRRLAQEKAREEARKLGPAAALNFKEGIEAVASGDSAGDHFQYRLDHKINLDRQKSAMLPILEQSIEGEKLSIYNEAIHARHPMLGVRLKNSTKQPLTHGPITVYDDQTYAGDTRILDLRPGEERLLSYALDQGTDVVWRAEESPRPDMAITFDGKALKTNYTLRSTRTYMLKNRSTHERAVLIEHPLRPNWKLIEPAKPAETSRTHLRFLAPVAAAKTEKLVVNEDQDKTETVAVTPGAITTSHVGKVHVLSAVEERSDPAIQITFSDDDMLAGYRMRRTTTYKIANDSKHERIVRVSQPIPRDWQHVEPLPGETTKEARFFTVKIAPGKTETLAVVEQRRFNERIAMPALKNPQTIVPKVTLQTARSKATTTLAELEIEKGMLKTTTNHRTVKTYTVDNQTDEDGFYEIVHHVAKGSMRIDADGVRVAGPSTYPFTVKAAKGTAAKHDIVEEVAVKAETALKSLGNDQLQQYADAPAASPGLRAALKETLGLRRKVEDGLKALADRDKEMKQVSEDQARLRSNLAIVPPSSEHYRKFLEKFVARETEIETMQKQIRELQAAQESRQRELESYLANLTAK